MSNICYREHFYSPEDWIAPGEFTWCNCGRHLVSPERLCNTCSGRYNFDDSTNDRIKDVERHSYLIQVRNELAMLRMYCVPPLFWHKSDFVTYIQKRWSDILDRGEKLDLKC